MVYLRDGKQKVSVDVQPCAVTTPVLDKEGPFQIVTYKRNKKADDVDGGGGSNKSPASKKMIGSKPHVENAKKSHARRQDLPPIKSIRIKGGQTLPSPP